MARAKYQVLVIPYRKSDDEVLYCIFQRSDMVDVNTVIGDPVSTPDGSTVIPISRVSFGFVAGGGEEEDGAPLISARREAFEEAGIPLDAHFIQLETTSSISTEHFPKARLHWGERCLVIPEYCFAVELPHKSIRISDEHTRFAWVDYATAMERLQYDSNKVALWELDNKIKLEVLS